MQDVIIPGYVHLFKISIGGLIFNDETQNSVCRFTASQGMSTSLAGLKKFLNEIENKNLVELRNKPNSPNLQKAQKVLNSIRITKDVDIFIKADDLTNLEKTTDAHFICYADSYMDSLDEFKNIIALALF